MINVNNAIIIVLIATVVIMCVKLKTASALKQGLVSTAMVALVLCLIGQVIPKSSINCGQMMFMAVSILSIAVMPKTYDGVTKSE